MDFKLYFLGFPTIQGWRHYRLVISIDGMHLYEKFKDKMLITIIVDAENKIYHLVYAIMDEEMTASWSWFLFQFRTRISQDRNRICLIFYRYPGILNTIIDESIRWSLPRAYHRYRLRYVCSNFNTHFKNTQLKRAVWQAGSTHQVRKLDFIMNRIKTVNVGLGVDCLSWN